MCEYACVYLYLYMPLSFINKRLKQWQIEKLIPQTEWNTGGILALVSESLHHLLPLEEL